MVRHYEILLLYSAGLRPKDVIRLGFSRSSAYRWHSIYRRAGKRLRNHIQSRNSVSPACEKKANRLDDLKHGQVCLALKYTLKNRPKANNPSYINDAEYWFEGFEAELREMIKPVNEGYSRPFVPLTVPTMIKEILGDTKNPEVCPMYKVT